MNAQNAHEQQVRQDLTEILESRGLIGNIVDDLVDAISALVFDAKRSSFIDGLNKAHRDNGTWPWAKSGSARRVSPATAKPGSPDPARQTRAGAPLKYSSAVQAGVLKRIEDAQPEAGL